MQVAFNSHIQKVLCNHSSRQQLNFPFVKFQKYCLLFAKKYKCELHAFPLKDVKHLSFESSQTFAQFLLM